MHTRLHTHIMRRIYYTYVMRTLINKRMLATYTLVVMALALAYSISLGDIYANLMAVRVGELGGYIYTAVTNTETWTLLLLVGIGVSLYVVITGSNRVQPRTFSHA